MALAHCILGKFLGVGCHCFPLPLDVPTFSARCLHVQRRERPLAAEGETLCGREMFRQISPRIRLPRNSKDLLHAANLRHGTDAFTSPPKNPTTSAGFEPANLGTKGQHAISRPPKLELEENPPFQDVWKEHLKLLILFLYYSFNTFLTFKNLASYIQDGRNAILQMLHLIYIYVFNKYKY
jgi:hypothetical protein